MCPDFKDSTKKGKIYPFFSKNTDSIPKIFRHLKASKIKINLICVLSFLNVTIRKIKITYLNHITFLLDDMGLGHFKRRPFLSK